MVPVSKGEEYIINIESISSDGSGVGHIQGFTVFVPDTCGGDAARVKITHVKPRFAYAVMIELIEKSPVRVRSECPYARECGGCQLRHMEYNAQLEAKKNIVENALRRIGGFGDFSIDKIIAADNPDRYRNKAVFKLEKSKNGVSYGFYSQKTHTLVPIADCLLCGSEFAKIAAAVTKYKNADAIESIFMRQSRKSGEIMVVISAVSSLKEETLLTDMVLEASKSVSSIILDNGSRVLYGKDTIDEEICGVRFSVSHKSFLQVNPEQTEKLYEAALSFADISPTDTVMDIYCGIGTISLCAARKAGRVIGIEKVPRAIEDARKNAELNGITNAEFYADSAENIVPRLIADGEKPDVIILDPPRAGSDKKTLAAISKASPKRIVYISCDSASLARDLRILSADGWRIEKSAACDMFPHTAHIETVVKLVRQEI